MNKEKNCEDERFKKILDVHTLFERSVHCALSNSIWNLKLIDRLKTKSITIIV